ncbi:hypothetical protein CBQ26_13280 [Deinococcus indicus]|uniref:Uncharacterized protein n=1 Tax=Deinococcus indicus TaxID=223556 RepID=A0A246BJE8_9DEIO|nr:hypothetical protein [Deinococcus indicus]OWL95021.1 hypothetical protein CBQ26_13280 [Deinococcus indicus]
MNKTEQTVLIGSGLVALAILAGSVIIAEKLSRSLEDKNFWAGSNIPQVAGDVHAVTGSLNQLVTSWTRA